MTSKRSRRLLERLRWPGHSARGGDAEQPPGPAAGPADGGQHHRGCAFDWQAAQHRWAVVGLKWDLAILANLYERDGCTSRELLDAINDQARAEHPLLPQYLSGRLRAMNNDGLVTYVDVSKIPRVRRYSLGPPGQALAAELSSMLRTAQQGGCGRASAAGAALGER